MSTPDPTDSHRSTKTGALLVNLGTPDAPRTPEVRRYLREFLSDPRVLDMPAPGRAALLNLIILPFRPAKSAELYRKIWTDDGSPLLVFGRELAQGVQAKLGPDMPVELAMRYGAPSIAEGLARLRAQAVDRVVVLPLYPQYASATGGSTLEKVFAEVGDLWNVPDIVTVPPFFDHPGFVRAFGAVGRPVLHEFHPDFVLMSYHGLPESQVRKGDEGGAHCLRGDGCCDALATVNRHCYRAQCFATSRLLAEELGLTPDRYHVSFQSRLGRVPWIKPYTDAALRELPKRGVKRLAVLCPAFVADCLETLEEIGLRGKSTFLAAGGEAFHLVPSLNAHPMWVEAVADMLNRGAK